MAVKWPEWWKRLRDDERQQWTLDPLVSVGPARFGASPGEVSSCPRPEAGTRGDRDLRSHRDDVMTPGGLVTLPDMGVLGSSAHRVIIEQVVARYRDDDRVRAVAVFGSIATGAWHELSDIDLDVVIGDDAAIRPADEVAALFGVRAVITLTRADSADVVLDSLEEISIRWHPLRITSPNIAASARVVYGELSDADLAAAGEANRTRPDEQQLLDALTREAVGAAKSLARGRRWEAAAAVERMRRSLLALRGQRDTLQLDPADPAHALALVIAETRAHYDLGPRRRALLDQIRPPAAI
jgi:predicted nucleotidyltransferase